MFKSKISVFFIIVFLLNVYSHKVTALNCNLPENRAACIQELEKTENEISDLSRQLESKQKEGVSLKRDKEVLDLQIKQAKLKIKSFELSIAKLGKDIGVKETNIQQLTSRIDKSRQNIAEMIKRNYEVDNISIVESSLSSANISDFFRDIDSYNYIQNKIKDEISYIKQDKKQEEVERAELDVKRDKEYDNKYEVEVEKKKIEKAEAEKRKLLNLNKKEQANYKGTISDKKAKVTQIKNALFTLRDSGSIKFQDAVKYAISAGNAAGIRPALVLAVLQQESNLGSNVGSCYLKDTETGSGVKISSGAKVNNVMKPSRDVTPFLRITKALGKDPFETRVSCPFTIGYGGAMGPAQFIPSTWEIFENRISKAKGGGVANPWNAGDAFMASAMYLGDLGASSKSYSSERNAACKYYSGASCGSRGNTFYGDQVMARALKLQADIDLIQE